MLWRARPRRRVTFATSFLAATEARPLPFRAAFGRDLAAVLMIVFTTFLVAFFLFDLPFLASRWPLVWLFHALRAGPRDCAPYLTCCFSKSSCCRAEQHGMVAGRGCGVPEVNNDVRILIAAID